MAMRFGRGRGAMGGRGRGSWKIRIAIAAVLVVIAAVGYFGKSTLNPITGKAERAGNVNADLALGLQAAPEMAAQFGGPSRDAAAQQRVRRIGDELVRSIPTVYQVDDMSNVPFKFTFTLLDDEETINAFALPGGPTFITAALYSKLETDGEIAGVMGHEVGHVIERHGAERMAKQEFMQGLSGAATVGTGDYSAGQIANAVGGFITMKYGREDELESDEIGVRLMAEAGYDPRSMIRVMEVLAEASGGTARQPEWASTHPDPLNRITDIKDVIDLLFPSGVPDGLKR